MTIDGFDEASLEDLRHPFANRAETPEEWVHVYDETLAAVKIFLTIHDNFQVISKCINQAMVGAQYRADNPSWIFEDCDALMLIELAELELVQALILQQVGPCKGIPASPKNMSCFLRKLPLLTYAFSRMQPLRYTSDDEREHLIGKIRMQTLHYRNHFHPEDCEHLVKSILTSIDHATSSEIGFAVSQMYFCLIILANTIKNRVDIYLEYLNSGLTAKSITDALRIIDFFCNISPAAERAWAKCRGRCEKLDDFRWAAFRLSELCHAWPYKFDKGELTKTFGASAVEFFEKISLRQGELASANSSHFFLKNPVWQKPFIDVDEHNLLLPLPSLFYSFPLQIFEQFLTGQPMLERAYSDARSKTLEEMIETCISSGMPSAEIYRNVMWRDDVTGKLFENDVVALIGNTIFLFEAKSGKLNDAARRGGELRLIRNFKELFIEPGEQAKRLEVYLNTNKEKAKLWVKKTNKIIDLHFDKPKLVHKFSICIEHFASLTNAKHYFNLLGLINDDEAWAPVLSIGELMIIWRQLDTEISFFHYLTRRATLEDVVDFEGDEMDILSMYLTNGLFINQDKLQGRKLRFLNVDGVVRVGKTPRQNRKEFDTLGIELGFYWRSTLHEIYRDVNIRHRFDILQVLLNQDPAALLGIVDVIQRWKGGRASVKDRDTIFLRAKVGQRVFVLAYHLTKHPMAHEEWTECARTIAHGVATAMFEASDCAVFLRTRRSKNIYWDAVSFFRFLAKP